MIYVVVGFAAALLMAGYSPRWVGKADELPGLVGAPVLAPERKPFIAKLALALSFLCLFLLASFRYGIGTDYFARYTPQFNNAVAGGEVDSDPGFVFLVNMVAGLTSEAQWLFVACSFITILLVYRFAIRMSLYPPLTIFLFMFGGIYLEAFNSVRQALAAALLVNTIELILRKKWIPTLAIIAMAMSIHLSAMIWVAVIPLVLIRTSRAVRIAATGLALAIVLSAPTFIYDLVGRFAPEYAWYFSSNYGDVRSYEPTELIIAAFLYLAISLVPAERNTSGRYSNSITNIYSLYALSLATTVSFSYAFTRLTSYFAPIQLVAVPLILSRIGNPRLRSFGIVMVIGAYFVSFTMKFLIWNAHGVLPYEWIFGDV